MKSGTTGLLVSCLLAACAGQLLPCAPDCSEPHTSKLFPNPHDCTKFFQCTGDFAIPRTCPDGLWFNAAIEVCDYPDSSGCSADPDYDCNAPGTTAPPSNSTPAANATTVFSTTELPLTSAGPNVTSVVNSTVFTSEVPVTTAAPNVTSVVNSTDFTSEVPVTTAAPNVTSVVNSTVVFTTTSEVGTTTEVEATTEVDTTTVEPAVTTTESSGSTTESGECTPECPSAEAIFPNPRDCASFFQCAFGYPFLHQCPEGQWYDGPNERCDYEDQVECNAGPDIPCIAVTNPTEEPPLTTTDGGSTTTDGGEECVPPCPSDEALYPNPRDCSTFFQCSFGVPFLMNCPPGQEYAAALERCDYPEIAQCTAGPDSPCVAVTNPPQFL